jgi:hypothetical protein
LAVSILGRHVVRIGVDEQDLVAHATARIMWLCWSGKH